MDNAEKHRVKVFRGSKFLRAFWAVVALIILLMSFGLGLYFLTIIRNVNLISSILWGSFTFVLMIVAFSSFWVESELAFRHKLLITHKGLWVHHYGKRFYAWDDLIELERVQSFIYSGWFIHASQVSIEHPSRVPRCLLRGLNKFLLKSNVSFHLNNNLIPVPNIPNSVRDQEKFKDTEFGQDLCHFAPHLFEEIEKSKLGNIS